MKKPFRPIVITGFMGAGKTAVAAVLARKLNCPIIDLDDFLSEREGRTPQAIIEEDGEQGFREIESAALREVLEKGAAVGVIALGGGTWTIADNRALIHMHGARTVWLDAPFELCWQRIKSGNKRLRPLARDLDSARALYDARRTFYQRAALRIQVDESKSAEMIAAEIVSQIAARGKGKP